MSQDSAPENAADSPAPSSAAAASNGATPSPASAGHGAQPASDVPRISAAEAHAGSLGPLPQTVAAAQLVSAGGGGHATTRFVPPHYTVPASDEESLDVWGFADSGFHFDEDGDVTFSGARYPAISGQKMPALVPWIKKVMKFDVDPAKPHTPNYPPQIPEPQGNAAFEKAMADLLPAERRTQDGKQRLRHGHGHTQEEMWSIKYGSVERVPDLVVWPETDEEVAAIVRAAQDHNAVLIPFGGGTNVTDALKVSASEDRFVVSLDTRRMNRIRWIDPVNREAHIEAGAVGRHIQEQLAKYGLMMGHEPDSVEFSTLGGWVATNASGMKKNRYGNIEQIVMDVTAVTTHGTIQRYHAGPRESVGIDARGPLFGSEGNLGVITSAVVKLFPLPECKEYGSVLFPDFESGLAFMYELEQSNAKPASARLVDNMQFQFSQALKPEKKGFKAKLISKIQKYVVVKLKGFDPERMTALTLVYEGTKEEVARQKRLLAPIAKRHGGMPAGGENGERGYALTFAIAYIRDFVMNHWVIAESFETSVPWTRAKELCDGVKARLFKECEDRGIPGKPFVTCRVTQLYETGVCIYFYFAFNYSGVENPSAVYSEIEVAARDEIMRHGGTLSHHHGIGKLRAPFADRLQSDAAATFIKGIRDAADPGGTFGTRNSGIGS